MKEVSYKYVVKIGKRAVAYSTTKREAEQEARRVGGFVESLLTKNPVDAAYNHYLGEGAFTKAFTRLDPGPAGVATQTLVDDRHGRDPEVSKILMCGTYEYLIDRGRTEIAAFFPALKPVRLEVNGDGKPIEMIFSMPKYTLAENMTTSARRVDRLLDVSLAVAKIINRRNTGTGDIESMIEGAQEALNSSFYADDAFRREVELMLTVVYAALRALGEIAETAKPYLGRAPRGDLHGGNIAVDSAGHLILLDPIVAYAAGPAQLLDLWEYFEFPVEYPGGVLATRDYPASDRYAEVRKADAERLEERAEEEREKAIKWAQRAAKGGFERVVLGTPQPAFAAVPQRQSDALSEALASSYTRAKRIASDSRHAREIGVAIAARRKAEAEAEHRHKRLAALRERRVAKGAVPQRQSDAFAEAQLQRQIDEEALAEAQLQRQIDEEALVPMLDDSWLARLVAAEKAARANAKKPPRGKA